MKLRIGSRGSRLALVQANWVAEALRSASPDLEIEIITIETVGDRDRSSSLAAMGSVGVFTKRIEEKLLENEIDLAVHSAKDMPSQMTEGLTIAAVPPRAPFEDVLIGNRCHSINELPLAATVGTSSPRRAAQIRHYRKDLSIREIRGNVETRIRKLDEGQYDAILMARAGLERLELGARISQLIPTDIMLPAGGQGFLLVQARSEDSPVLESTDRIDDIQARTCLESERTVLARLGAGCAAAVGVLATSENESLLVRAVVLDKGGNDRLFAERQGTVDAAKSVAEETAAELLAQGAHDLMER